MKNDINLVSGTTFTENSQQEDQQLAMQRRKQIEQVDRILIKNIFSDRTLRLSAILQEYEKILSTTKDLPRNLEAMYIYSQIAFLYQALTNYEQELEYLEKILALAAKHKIPNQKIIERIASCKDTLSAPKALLVATSVHEINQAQEQQRHIQNERLYNLGVNTLFGTNKSVLNHLPESIGNTESPESLLKSKKLQLITLDECLDFYENRVLNEPNNVLLYNELRKRRDSLANEINKLCEEISIQHSINFATRTEANIINFLQIAKTNLDAGNLSAGLLLIRTARSYLNSAGLNTAHFKNPNLANLEPYTQSIEFLENYLKVKELLPALHVQRILALIIPDNAIFFEIHKERIEQALTAALEKNWYKIHDLTDLQLNGLFEGLALLINNDLESRDIASSMVRSSLRSILTLYFNSIAIAIGSTLILGLKHSKAMPHMLENLIASYPESGKPYTLPLFPDQEFLYSKRMTNNATEDRRIDVMPTLDKWEAWLRDDTINPDDKTSLIQAEKARFKWQYNLQQGSIVAPPPLSSVEALPVGTYESSQHETTANAAKNRIACSIQ